jgi:RHS repeat-associated protein
MSSRMTTHVGNTLVGVLILCGAAIPAAAQAYLPGSPTPAVLGPGSPGQVEYVDPINGNLTLQFPVGKLPAGPGGFSAGVNLSYNSAFYVANVINSNIPQVILSNYYYAPSELAGIGGNTLLAGPATPGGWSYNMRYSLWSNYQIGGKTGHSMYLTTPDGANHLLILTGVMQNNSNGQSSGQLLSSFSMFNHNYSGEPVYDVDLDGTCPLSSTGYSGNSYCTSSTSNFNGTFVFATADSTYIRVESNTFTGNWTAYLPDGGQATGSFYTLLNISPPGLAAQSATISDRNGNTVTFSDFCDEASTASCATVITDQFGREVNIEYNLGTSTIPNVATSDTITQPGLNGRVQTIVNWSTVPLPYLPGATTNEPSGVYNCGYIPSPPFVTFSTCQLLEQPLVVSSIQLPSGSNNGPSAVYLFSVSPISPVTTCTPSNNGCNEYNWGELHTMTRMELASGGNITLCSPSLAGATAACPFLYQINYTYLYDGASQTNGGMTNRAMGTLVNPVAAKTLTYQETRDGAAAQTLAETTSYQIAVPASFNPSGPPVINGTNVITGPDGSVTQITVSNQSASTQYSCTPSNLSGLCPVLPYSVLSADGTLTTMQWAANTAADPTTGNTFPAPTGGFVNPYPQYVLKTLGQIAPGSSDNVPVFVCGSNCLSKMTGAALDENGNTLSTVEYDWFPSAQVSQSGNYARATNALYNSVNAPAYWNHNAVSGSPSWTNFRVPQNVTVTSGAGQTTVNSSNPAGSYGVQFSYDNYNSTANVMGEQWTDLVSGATLSRGWTYLSNGNMLTATDASGSTPGVVTTFSYDANQLYPTGGSISPMSSATSAPTLTTSMVVDFNSGLVTSTKDVNNNLTASYQYDNLGRPTLIDQLPSQSAMERTSATSYDDVGLSVTTYQDQYAKNDRVLSATTYYDPLGRVRLSVDSAGNKKQRAYRNGIAASIGCVVPSTQHGIAATATIVSCELDSNPYSLIDSTMGWTLKLQTSLDPVTGQAMVEEQTYGGQSPPAPWGNNMNVTGTVVVATNNTAAASCWPAGAGTTADVRDQANNLTRYCIDGLGRMVGVTDAASNITQHTYDLEDHPASTTQSGVLARTFTYSLGRLTQACNPETSGTVGSTGCVTYAYDPATGGFLRRTDPSGRITCIGSLSGSNCTAAFDGLNRPTERSYSGTITPTVNYSYDGGGWVGALSNVGETVGGNSYSTAFSYDSLGRVIASSQAAAGNAHSFPFAYSYTLTDALTQVQYPNGQGSTGEAVDYQLDSAGRVNSVKNDSTSYAYASPIAYTPADSVAALTFGNGVTELATWNDRLQLTQLSIAPPQLNASGGAPPSLLTINLFPCLVNGNAATSCSSGNVGSIQGETLAVPGLNTSRTYGYDALNHLTSASETVGGQGSAAWSQTYGYVGGRENRYVSANTGTNAFNLSPITPTSSGDYNSNNQLQSSGNVVLAPDGSGELTTIGPYTILYDVEGRMSSVTFNSLLVTQSANFIYDGQGRRVVKLVCPTAPSSCSPTTPGAVETVYVYDAGGNLSQEYSTNPPTAPCQICFISVDQVGSTRLITDGAGSPVSRYDYLPFGEEIPADGTIRTRAMGYQSQPDGVNPKFTGQVRDAETGFDYFNARYYDARAGRFVSPDPGNAGASPNDPTTWNGYAYVGNNPLALTDASGESFWSSLVELVKFLVVWLFPPAEPFLFPPGSSSGAYVSCGGPFVSCGGVNDQPLSENVPGSANVSNGGGFVIYNLQNPNGTISFAVPGQQNQQDDGIPHFVLLGGVGHHGFPGWRQLPKGTPAYRFFSKWRTGPLEDPSKHGWKEGHPEYNETGEELRDDYLKQLEKSAPGEMTHEESQEMARRIIDKPEMRQYIEGLGNTQKGESALDALIRLITEIDPIVLIPVFNPKVFLHPEEIGPYHRLFCQPGKFCGS